jgi:hypothetical protein
MPRRVRFIVWTVAVAALLGGQLAWLVLLRGTRLFARGDLLIGGQLALGAVVLVIALLLRTTPPDAIKLRRRTGERVVLLGTVLLQAAAVALLLPGLSEDVVRYRSDGRLWLAGRSPYATAPADFKGADAVDRLVPFPHLRTIYPAAAQGAFALAAGTERALGVTPRAPAPAPSDGTSPWRHYLASAPSAYRAIVFRVLFAAALVLATVAALRLLRATDQSPWWATLLAWSPLATIEIGGMGHVDALGLLLLLLALLALARNRWIAAGAWLALATAVKPFGLLLVPFALRDASRRSRGAAAPARRLGASFALAMLLLFLPPLLYRDGYRGWRQTARTYSRAWGGNGSVYEVLTRTLGQGEEGRAMARAKETARLLAAAAVLATAVLAWQAGAATASAGYALSLAALLVAPVVYPWYALWPLCFVPFLRGRFGWAALVWAATIGISYELWHATDWRLSPALMAAEYVPVYLAVAVELGIAVAAQRRGATHRASPLQGHPTSAGAVTAPAGPAPTPSCR